MNLGRPPAIASVLLLALCLVAACRSGPPDAGSAGPSPTVSAAPASTTAPSPSGRSADPPSEIDSGMSRPELRHDGLVRTYRLYVSASAATTMRRGERVPLVLSFHGAFDDNESFSGTDRMEALADQAGFVVAHPAGLASGLAGGAWNAGGCCSVPAKTDIDDVGFVTAVIDDIEHRVPIDDDRVYAMGHSNGGMLSYRLACESSERIAAAGSVAGTLEVPICHPPRPVPFVHIHSRDDNIVPFAGGRGELSPVLDDYAFHSVASSIETIRAADGCDTAQPSSTTSTGVVTTTWTCRAGSAVRQVIVPRSAHFWPTDVGHATAFGRDAGAELWSFLSAFSRP